MDGVISKSGGETWRTLGFKSLQVAAASPGPGAPSLASPAPRPGFSRLGRSHSPRPGRPRLAFTGLARASGRSLAGWLGEPWPWPSKFGQASLATPGPPPGLTWPAASLDSSRPPAGVGGQHEASLTRPGPGPRPGFRIGFESSGPDQGLPMIRLYSSPGPPGAGAADRLYSPRPGPSSLQSLHAWVLARRLQFPPSANRHSFRAWSRAGPP